MRRRRIETAKQDEIIIVTLKMEYAIMQSFEKYSYYTRKQIFIHRT